MYYTHHFAHHSTLRRVCDWLQHFGFDAERLQVHTEGTPWLSIPVGAGQLAEIEMLVNAVEGSDPQGWPSFWDEARLPHSAPSTSDASSRSDSPGAGRSTIGWHPLFEDRSDLDAIHDAMGR